MRLRTLGGLSLEGLEFGRPKPLLLLAFLAIEGPAPRRDLGRLFFPDATDAADSLSTTLRRLRRASPALVVSQGSRLGTEVRCDATTMLAYVRQGALERALDLYGGVFLEGIAVRLGEELEDWVFVMRERIGEEARTARTRLAERALESDDVATARRWAEAAFLTRGAPEPESGAALELHSLLRATRSPLAAEAQRVVRQVTDLPLDENRAITIRDARYATTSFIGRRQEVREALRGLQDAGVRLLTITGAGGVGKTRLALEVARALTGSPRFGHGACVVRLESLTDPALVPSAIASTLGLDPVAAANALATLVAVLAERRILLVLDDFEQVRAAAPIVDDLVRSCPGLSVVVTSRLPLALHQEHVLPLSGLGVQVDDERGTDPDALTLFIERVRSVRVGFAPSEEERATALAIVRNLHGHPLAIELAASWARAMALQDIAEEITTNLDFLADPSRDGAERHRSLRAVFDHTCDLLSASERAALAALSVFSGGFRHDAARAVCGTTLPTLRALVDASLLQVSSDGRYRLHPLVHAYASERLHADTDAASWARRRHGEYVFGLFADLEDDRPSGLAGPSERQRLDAELDNLRSAWRWAVDEAPARLQRSLASMWRYFITQPRCAEGLVMTAGAIERLAANDPAQRGARAAALLLHAGCAWWMGDVETMAPCADEGLALMRDLDDPVGIEFGLVAKGAHAWRSGAYADAKRAFEESLAIALRLDHRVSRALQNLGHAERLLGNYGRSREHFEAAAERNRRDGRVDYLAGDLANLAVVVALEGDLELAQALVDEAEECARAITKGGHHVPLAAARVALMRRELGRCRALAERVLEGHDGSVSAAGRIEASLLVARCDTLEGRTQEAWTHVERALRTSLRSRARPMMLLSVFEAAVLLMRAGQPADAATIAQAIAAHPVAEAALRDEAKGLLRVDLAGVVTGPHRPAELRLEVAVRAALRRGAATFVEKRSRAV